MVYRQAPERPRTEDRRTTMRIRMVRMEGVLVNDQADDRGRYELTES